MIVERIRPTKQIITYSIILLALMALDVALSYGVLTQSETNISEGNTFALGIGTTTLAILKLLFAIGLCLYSLWRKSVKGVRLATILMGILIIWNIAMLVIFR